MAHRTRDAGMIGAGAALAALVSPVRQEIVDTIEALGGDAAVADIAAQLGRPADGFYYHLRRLVDAGVLREGEDRGDGRGRRYRTVAQRGKRIHLKYGRGSRSNPGTVAQVVAGMLRTAERDFASAIRDASVCVEGETRELWASRSKGWVGERELVEINRALARISALLKKPRSAQRAQLVSVTWVVAPVTPKPARR